MEASEVNVGQLVKTKQYFHGVPPNTLGVICRDDGDQLMIAWYLCDRPLPNLTPYSIAELPEDDPQCPLRDSLDKATELQYFDPA